MSSAIYPDPPRLVTAVCGHGEQQRLSNARLRLTFYNAPVAYCGPARPGSAFQQSAVSGLLPRARIGRAPGLSNAQRRGDWRVQGGGARCDTHFCSRLVIAVRPAWDKITTRPDR